MCSIGACIEEWKDIDGYNGDYQVSTTGRIKSYKNANKPRILSLFYRRSGYLRVTLCKNGKLKTHDIHRLVAKAFLPNPLNLPEVNHKDEDSSNNRVENLEWCTSKYNANYGGRTEKIRKALKGKPKPRRRNKMTKNKLLNEVNLNDLGKDFYTVSEAAQILGCHPRKVYSHKPDRKEGGRSLIHKSTIVFIAKHENAILRRREFSKETGLYPKRRRTGNYKDYYREIEVLYKLGITKDELDSLVSEGKLTRTKFSKKGEKRVGYNIMEVLEYTDSVDIKA